MSLSRRFFVLLLGAFLALGMNLPAVRAMDMPAKMTMTGGMDMSGHCKDYGGKSGTAKEMTGCSLGCAAPILAVIPQTLPTRIVLLPVTPPQQDSLLLGRAFSPDPDPPRFSDNG